jgi:Mor family transcriptional regulator
MKGVMHQQKLDFYPDNPLNESHGQILEITECICDMRKGTINLIERTKRQGALLKETTGLLKDIQTMLFDIRQGELFDDENIEAVDDKDDVECKDEVLGELRELLGNEQAEKVANYFSGSLVYFSKNIIITRKYHEIRKAFGKGATYRDLSVKYGYTETHIRRIIHKRGKTT